MPIVSKHSWTANFKSLLSKNTNQWHFINRTSLCQFAHFELIILTPPHGTLFPLFSRATELGLVFAESANTAVIRELAARALATITFHVALQDNFHFARFVSEFWSRVWFFGFSLTFDILLKWIRTALRMIIHVFKIEIKTGVVDVKKYSVSIVNYVFVFWITVECHRNSVTW